MDFAEVSIKIQEMLRPYHALPAINTLIVLEWLNRGLDPEKQILPVIHETICRKLRAKKAVPVSLKYYDAVLKDVRPLPKNIESTDSPKDRDLKLAKIYRHQMTMSITRDMAQIKLQRLQAHYGEDFGT